MARNRSRGTCIFFGLLAPLLLVSLPLASCALRATGEELVKKECTRCHTLAPIAVEGRARAEWEEVVHRMVGHGADLRAGQVERVVDYLVENYGPGGQ
jgi:hypothetical protein